MGAYHAVRFLYETNSEVFEFAQFTVSILVALFIFPVIPEILLLTDYVRNLKQNITRRAFLVLAELSALEILLLIMAMVGDGVIWLFIFGGNVNAILLWLSMKYYEKHLEKIPGAAAYAAVNLAAFVLTWLLPLYLDIPLLFLGWLVQFLLFLFLLTAISRQKFQEEDVRIPAITWTALSHIL